MKVIFDKQTLKQVLGNIQGLAGRKTNLVITESVLLEAHLEGGGHVRLVATDLETGIDARIPAKVAEAGSIAVSAKWLYDLVKDFPYSEVPVHEVENRWIEIKQDRIDYHMVGMNPEDFPDALSVDDVDFFEVPAAAFSDAIGRAVVIDPVDDTRAHVAGIHLTHRPEDKTLRMVSTDGKRFALADLGYVSAGVLENGVLVPKRGMREVRRFLSGHETARIGVGGSQFVVRCGDTSFHIRLLEGEFPDMVGILARRGQGAEVVMKLEAAVGLIKRMSVFTTSAYRAVSMSFSFGILVARATNPEIGESREEMEIDYSGNPVEAHFNPRFLLDAIQSVGGGEDVIFEPFGDAGPMFVTGADPSYVGCVMPMKE